MIGVIADDVTGATDVAAALSRAGLRTLLALTPELGEGPVDAEAIAIGLKTRSIPVADAVAQSLAALAALRAAGAELTYFKYCSTFDSTPEGNIGPVTDALAAELGAELVVTTPAAPLHGRTVYRGRLFVGDQLLDETHMREHPVTPMRDSSVPRLLAPQVAGEVGLLPLDVVRAGAAAVREAVAAAEASGVAHLVADAAVEADLDVIAEAVDGAALVAGSAGLVGALARRRPSTGRAADAAPAGRTAILAGSCSRRTLEQIDRFQATGAPSYRLRAERGDTAEQLAADALAWWDAQSDGPSALIYSSSPAAERDAEFPEAGELYERTAGIVADGLAERGVQRLVIAGGETSGEVVRALGMGTAVVGAEAALGAPWIHDPRRDLHLVLKSGNFGGPELFVDVAGVGADS
ncbi:four-carbon acid sugar kinase family protein [Agromyces mediolanus]|uniref:3-oxo-tetronate kinase n=1 Tax=Agromyces mediolanus TaxID=41986 RepID=UPI00203B44D2|nr:3-oxo-tetronate kinase [Agromyces mediolanus]MCM3656362.1 four-carbon acid sugar kinase family protein [Agromyces mediolanus]